MSQSRSAAGSKVLTATAAAQLHAIVLALCASIIAPFGGFFASGFKRSFKVKDFGNSIPGHGGMTDRMDCQVQPPHICPQTSLLRTSAAYKPAA